MTAIRPNLLPVENPFAPMTSDATALARQLGASLEARETEERAQTRESEALERAAHSEMIADMRDAAKQRFRMSLGMSALQLVSSAGSCVAGAAPNGSTLETVAKATHGLSTVLTSGLDAVNQSRSSRAEASEAASRRQLELHARAREASNDSANGARSASQRMRETLDQMSAAQAQTMRRILA